MPSLPRRLALRVPGPGDAEIAQAHAIRIRAGGSQRQQLSVDPAGVGQVLRRANLIDATLV